MTNFLKTAVLCLLFALCAIQNSQAQALSAADQKEIDATYANWMDIFHKLDASLIAPLLTENAVEINPLGSITRGKANLVAGYVQLFEFFKSLPKPDSREEKMLDYQGRYLGTDLVLINYTSENTSHFGPKTVVEKMAESVVLRKVNGQWLAELICLTPVTEMPAVDMGSKN